MQKTNRVPKLSRTASHRRAMFRNMAVSLIDKERIVTTRAKAKAIRPLLERYVTLGKRASQKDGADRLHLHRILLARIQEKAAVQKLMSALADRYANRAGGYLRIIHLKFRESDQAPLSIIEFVDKDENDGLQKHKKPASVSLMDRQADKDVKPNAASPDEGKTDRIAPVEGEGDGSEKAEVKKSFFKNTGLGKIAKVRKGKAEDTSEKKVAEKKSGKKKDGKVKRKSDHKQKRKEKKEETVEELKRKERSQLLLTPTKKKKSSKKKLAKKKVAASKPAKEKKVPDKKG